MRRIIRTLVAAGAAVSMVIALITALSGIAVAVTAPSPRPGLGHGTSLQGTIAAKSNSGTRAKVKHAAAPALPDATGALSTVSSVTVNGGYTAAGIGMRNLGYGTISITGVPAGAAVKSATLLWDVLGDSPDPTFAQGTFDGTAITGTEWASGPTPCWDAVASNFSYEADVTSLVTGNGPYNLTGFASGESDGADPWNVGSTPPLLEGASLVVVYTLASMPQTTIQIGEGATETDTGNTATATLGGFTASASPPATTTYIVADGQYGDSAATFNSTTLPGVTFPGADPQAVPNYSLGNLWDTTTTDVSSLVNSGDTSATLSVTGYDDCLVWVGQVLAVSGSPSNVTSITERIKATTALYKIDLTVGLQNVTCPATLSLLAGPLAPRSVTVCTSGQTAPSSLHVLQPVFNSSGELPPDSTFSVTASVNGGTAFGTILATPPAPIWVGVGDSYSSGHHQTSDNTLCWFETTLCGVYKNDPSFSWVADGTNSAASLLNARLKVPSDWSMTYAMLAKSGAKATDYVSDGQIAAMQSAIETHGGSWNVVSFTGGANDTNLRGILSNYYHAHPSGKPWAVTSWSKSNCPDSDTFYSNAISAAPSIKAALKNIIATASASSASTRFVDVEYPYIVPTSNVCGINHSTSTGTWFGSNAAVNYLDNLHKNISAPGLVHVNLRSNFDTSSSLSDLQLIRYFGYPHPDATGQQLIAKLAAAAVK